MGAGNCIFLPFSCVVPKHSILQSTLLGHRETQQPTVFGAKLWLALWPVSLVFQLFSVLCFLYFHFESFSHYIFIYYLICMCVYLCEFLYTTYVQEGTCRGQREQSDPPELDLHMVISCHVGAGNQILQEYVNH